MSKYEEDGKTKLENGNSKLTRLLQDSLGGNTKTLVRYINCKNVFNIN